MGHMDERKDKQMDGKDRPMDGRTDEGTGVKQYAP